MGIEAAKKVGTTILVIITLIIAVITIIGATAPSPDSASFLVYIAIAMPAVLIANLLIAIYWACKMRIWFLIPIIAILANWNYLTAVINVDSPSKDAHNLKVATYNVGSFNQEITGYTAKEISKFMDAQEGVDVLCMQEYTANNEFNLDSLSKTFKNYPYQSVPIDKKGGTRVVIFSKFPIVKSIKIAFKNTQNCAMFADIIVNNSPVRIFNLHLQTTSLQRDLSKGAKNNLDAESTIEQIERSLLDNSKLRAQQVKVIRELIKKSPHPVIVCGDFNAIPSTYEYNVIGDILSDGFKECGSGYAYSFNRFARSLRIDYIFNSKSIKGVNYYSTPKEWSDHNPVIMELSFGKNESVS